MPAVGLAGAPPGRGDGDVGRGAACKGAARHDMKEKLLGLERRDDQAERRENKHGVIGEAPDPL